MTAELDGHGSIQLVERELCTDEILTAAVVLAQYATDNSERIIGDTVFDFVTEGRATWSKYSACGDLPHFIAWCLGCRDERIINRDHDCGGKGWRVGQNLSMLVYGTGKLFTWAKPGDVPPPGCMLYVSTPEHVCVLESWDDETRRVVTHDYGQWDADKCLPCAKKKTTKVTRAVDGRWNIGGRHLVGWLDFSKLPLTETALVPASFQRAEAPQDNG